MFLTDSSEWCSMLGICCSFTLKLLKQCFSFVSQNIYTRYTKNLGGGGGDLKLLLETVVIQIFQRTQNRDQELTIAQFYWLLIVAKSFSLLQKCRTSLPNTKSLQILQPPGDASLLKGTKAVKLNICPVRTNEKKKADCGVWGQTCQDLILSSAITGSPRSTVWLITPLIVFTWIVAVCLSVGNLVSTFLAAQSPTLVLTASRFCSTSRWSSLAPSYHRTCTTVLGTACLAVARGSTRERGSSVAS